MDLVNSPSRNSMLLRSVINILFGAALLLLPGLSLLIVSVAFAVNLLILGIFMIFEPTIDTKNKHSILTVILGLLAVGAGVYMLSRPLAGVIVLSLLLACWAFMYGVIDLMLGFKQTGSNKAGSWVFLLAGLLSIIFAVYIAFNPLEGSLTLIWVVGLYSIAIGLVLGFETLVRNPAKNSKSVK